MAHFRLHSLKPSEMTLFLVFSRRAYESLERCLSPHQSRCDITMKRLYQSLENVYQFICYQAFQGGYATSVPGWV